MQRHSTMAEAELCPLAPLDLNAIARRLRLLSQVVQTYAPRGTPHRAPVLRRVQAEARLLASHLAPRPSRRRTKGGHRG